MTDLVPGLGSPVILRREALACGMTDRTIGQLVKGGVWHRVRTGAFVDGETWRDSTPEARHLLTVRAVLRQSRTHLVVSHSSAAIGYAAPTWGLRMDEVNVTRRDARTGRAERGIRQHRGLLLPGDVQTINGLPTTAPARTVLDVTTQASTEASLVVTNYFLHRKLTTVVDLLARYAHMEQHPFTLRTGLVLKLADGRFESVGETRTFFLCWWAGIPAPVPQWEVYDDTGRLFARLDLAWPEHRVWIEFDGRAKYLAHRRKGESVADCVLREKAREDRIRELTGWVCIRLTWDDLAHPARTAERIRRLLGTFTRGA